MRYTRLNGTTEHALRVWNCFFTDGAYVQASTAIGPDANGSGGAMYLANINGNLQYQPDCVLVIDD